MARKAETIFAKPAPSKTAPTTNEEGYPAFHRSPEQQLLQTLMTNTFGDTFYVPKEKLVAQSEQVHTLALSNPSFYAKALGYARNKGFVRTQPVYGLARLSALGDRGPGLSLFEQAFESVVRTPADLGDFASIIEGMGRGQGGRRIKRVAGNWLRDKMNDYWAIKYGSDNKGYSLKDLFRVYHPRDITKRKHTERTGYLVGQEVSVDADSPIAYFERLKRTTEDAEKILCIREGRLPHEVATSFAGSSRRVWEAIIPNMPIFALLRNLATLERHGVLDAAKERIEALFSNAEVVGKSKIFPFRFMEAIKHVNAPWAQDACRSALELSFGNAEPISGKTFIALDVSGSMASYIQAASVFALATARRSPGSVFCTFNDYLQHVPVSKHDSILTQARNIRSSGGTRTEVVADALIGSYERFDNVILVTDEQQNQGGPFMDRLEVWRRGVGRNSKLFVLNVAPYNGALVNPDDKGNYYAYGLTEAALNFIAYASRGWGSFVEHVRRGDEEQVTETESKDE